MKFAEIRHKDMKTVALVMTILALSIKSTLSRYCGTF